MSLIDTIRYQLAVEAPNLQVSPRRARFTQSGAVPVPANGSVRQIIQVSLTDIMSPDDGLLFDLFFGALGPLANLAAGGLVVTDLLLTMQGASGAGIIELTTPVSTTLTPRNQQSLLISPPPYLSARDLDNQYRMRGGVSLYQDQPLRIQLVVGWANTTAVAVNVAQDFGLFYRYIQGLREG